MHLTPAGLPSGIPGIEEDIEIAMQQAPQSGRHSINEDKRYKTKDKRYKIQETRNKKQETRYKKKIKLYGFIYFAVVPLYRRTVVPFT